MHIRMNVQITGTRDGEHWPAPGHTVDLPEAEALTLIRQGTAEHVRDEAPRKRGRRGSAGDSDAV